MGWGTDLGNFVRRRVSDPIGTIGRAFDPLGLGEQAGLYGPNADPFNRVNIGQIQLPHFEEDRARLGGMLGQGGPYAQSAQLQGPGGENVGALVSQLQGMAAGRGPSLAEQQYRGASQDALSQQAALAAGGGPGAARMAALQQGRIGQGMAAGVAGARTAEQMGAIGQLQGALGMQTGREALQAQLNQQTNLANQNAYLDILGKQLGLSAGQLQALIAQGQVGAQLAGAPTGYDKLINMGSQVAARLGAG